MKNIVPSLFGRKRLLDFTEKLSELLSGGCSLQNSLEIMSRMALRDEIIRKSAVFLHKSISDGRKFSLSLKMLPYLRVDEWYVAFISAAEESGALSDVLSHVKEMLCREKVAREKIVSAMVYPLLVTVLSLCAGFLSVFVFIPEFSSFFGSEATEIKSRAIKSLVYSDIFLVSSFAAILFWMRKIIGSSPIINVFRTIAFMSGKSIPVFQAVSCSFSFSSGNKKIARVLLEIKKRLMNGEKVARCFGEAFMNCGFKDEGRLLCENLALCEETGKSDGFEKSARILEAKMNWEEKLFLSCLQPLLLVLCAVYMTLVLKSAFLPFITNIGGMV